MKDFQEAHESVKDWVSDNSSKVKKIKAICKKIASENNNISFVKLHLDVLEPKPDLSDIYENDPDGDKFDELYDNTNFHYNLIGIKIVFTNETENDYTIIAGPVFDELKTVLNSLEACDARPCYEAIGPVWDFFGELIYCTKSKTIEKCFRHTLDFSDEYKTRIMFE
jgi:hypothetical protein